MRVAVAALVVLLLTAAGASAGTKLQSTWAAPDARPGTFRGKPVVAVFMSQDEALRRGVELSLATELTKRGAKGVPAYSLVATADMRDEEKVKARFTAAGAIGIVALRLVGRDQQISGDANGYYIVNSYSGVWGGYWGYGWSGVYDPGYLKTETVLRVEILVYSVEQNKLVWAGQSESTNPKNADSLVRDLVGKVAGEMKKQGLVSKGQ